MQLFSLLFGVHTPNKREKKLHLVGIYMTSKTHWCRVAIKGCAAIDL